MRREEGKGGVRGRRDGLEESVEVGVTVAGPLAALHHVQLVQGEGDGGRQRLDLDNPRVGGEWGGGGSEGVGGG